MTHRLRATAGQSPRVVFDTNVVMSALVFAGGISTRLREGWQSDTCVPLVSTVTVQELIRVLAYPKFRLSADEQHELLADYLPYATSIRIPQPTPAVPACRDPFDLPFLHLAVAGKADALISGDKDLLALAGRTRFAILTLAEFFETP